MQAVELMRVSTTRGWFEFPYAWSDGGTVSGKLWGGLGSIGHTSQR